jgi:nucleoside-diphosphate-sugar epimerase
MALCILRSRFIIGHGDRSTMPALARLFRRGVMIGSGAQQLSVIHVDDYADLILTIAEAMAGPAATDLPRQQVFNVAYRQPLRLADVRAAFARQEPLARTWFKVPVSASVLRALRAWPVPPVAALAVKLELTGLSQVLDVSSLERAWGGTIPSKDPHRALTTALAEMEDVP